MSVRLASIICAVLGLCLSAAGSVFYYMGFSDTFKGIYTGPILLGLSLALQLKRAVTKSEEGSLSSSRTRLHTLLTYWPKYGAPIMFLLAIIAFSPLVQWHNLPAEAWVPVVLFLSVLLLFSIVLSYLLHFVYLTDEELLIKRYSKEVTYSRAAIESIKPVFINLYLLKTHDGVKRLFMPRLSQVTKDLFDF